MLNSDIILLPWYSACASRAASPHNALHPNASAAPSASTTSFNDQEFFHFTAPSSAGVAPSTIRRRDWKRKSLPATSWSVTGTSLIYNIYDIYCLRERRNGRRWSGI